MVRGRKPKAIEAKVRNGSARPGTDGDRITSNLTPDDGPIKPDFVCDDPVASQFWDDTVAQAIPGVLREMDSASLAGMCRLWSQWRVLDRLYIESPTDRMIGSQWRGAWTALEKLLACYGMNPADRQRLKGSGLEPSAGMQPKPDMPPPRIAEGT